MSSTVTEDSIRRQWPLHWLVWVNNHKGLDRLLAEKQNDPEQLDPRGRTPLHLAVTLGRVECTNTLLRHNANALAVNRHHWSVLHEAVCTGNPELIGLVLQHRDQQQKILNIRNIPVMLERLQSTADYYIEMKWEFSSWIPLVSRMCPSDTCKIWKKGTTVRVDTTLIGFNNLKWQRGHQTLIFEATPKGHRICDINHDEMSYWSKEFKITEQTADPVQTIMSQEMGVLQRLTSPVVSTYVDTDSIAFQRQKSGIWGFRSEKVEQVHGYTAKVFNASGLNIKTNTRVEHLPEKEKRKQKSINPLHDFLGAAQDHAASMPAAVEAPPTGPSPAQKEESENAPALPKLTMEEYFTVPKNKDDHDGIGRPPEVNSRSQKLKATVCLAEGFPLDLQEQVMPIIDLMAMNTPHFAKVKDFINLQMPSGFPIRFEIPLFHLMAAKVTFSNINGHVEPVPHVSLRTEQTRVDPVPSYTPTGPVSLATTEVGGVKHRHTQASVSEDIVGSSVDPDDDEVTEKDISAPAFQTKEICTISEDCFTVPATYHRLNRGMYSVADEEEELLQLAIRQSLLEQEEGERGTSLLEGGRGNEQLSLKEALKDRTMMAVGDQEAMQTSQGRPLPPPPSRVGTLSAEDEEFELALALSRQMAEEEQRTKRREEEDLGDDELQRVLKLSMEDK